MLDVLDGLKLYKGFKKCIVTVDAYPEDYLNKFDAVVSSGCFLKAHFPAATFEIMNQSLKVGGFCFFTLRDLYLDPTNEMQYWPTIDALIKSGKIEIVE